MPAGQYLKFVDLIVRNGVCYAIYINERGRHIWIPKKSMKKSVS